MNLGLESAELHRAIARYRVLKSRWTAGRRIKQLVSDNLSWDEARQRQAQVDAEIALAEPEMVNCMGRTLAVIELANGDQVARIMGYGPNFCIVRAAAAVQDHLMKLQGASGALE